MSLSPAKTAPEKTTFWKSYGEGALRIICFIVMTFLLYSNPETLDQWRFHPQPLSNLITAIRGGTVTRLKVNDREIRGYYTTGERVRVTKEPSVSLSETLRPYNLNGSFEKISVDYQGTPMILSILRWMLIFILARYSILRSLGEAIREMAESTPSGKGPLGRMKNRKKEADLTTTLADVAGSVPVKDELREIVDFLRNPDKYTRIGAQIPRGILLSGPPGVGKTLLARAIAGEAVANFFLMNASEFVELYAGNGARKVRELFEQARAAAPAIIFIDEIDGLAARRQGDSNSEERVQTLNQLLVEMDGFNTDNKTIVIAATNRPEALDSAILRPGRFDRRISVPLPTRDEREEILKLLAKSRKLEQDTSLSKIAERTSGFSGADLKAVLNEAALLAVRTNEPAITQAHLFESIDKQQMGLKHHRPPTIEERRRTAIHEAGHALVAFIYAGERVQRISLVGRGDAGGFTRSSFTENETTTMTLKMMTGRLAVLMGGYAAEKIAYTAEGVSTGLSSDLAQATRIAYAMTKRFGMGKKTGLFAVSAAASSTTRAAADEDVRMLLREAAESAHHTLEKNKITFDRLVNELLAREALEEDEIRALLN